MEFIRRICAALESEYGRPEFVRRGGANDGPLDELVLTILSQNTSSANYRRAYAGLKARFGTWDGVRNADAAEIEDAIRSGGLAHIKASRIKQVLNDLYAMHGSMSLDFLADMPDKEAREFLMQFHGIGIKTASCVLMFSLGRPVFPVDTHVHRIAQRLGLITSGVSAEAAHAVLQSMIPDENVYSFHVNLVTHGRLVCKAQNPKCGECELLPLCSYGQRRMVLEE